MAKKNVTTAMGGVLEASKNGFNSRKYVMPKDKTPTKKKRNPHTLKKAELGPYGDLKSPSLVTVGRNLTKSQIEGGKASGKMALHRMKHRIQYGHRQAARNTIKKMKSLFGAKK